MKEPPIQRQTRILFVLTILFMLATVTALYLVRRLERSAFQALAQQSAALMVETMNVTRVAYSEDVVAKVREHTALRVAPDHADDVTGVPNPATFAIELGESLSDPKLGRIVRLYSHFPFPNRLHTGGPQDAFERDALQALLADPGTPVFRVEPLMDQESFRYAEAILMQQSCVDCHNSHPSSPKRDWQVGDVRGVLEVTQPLFASDSRLSNSVFLAYAVFSLLTIFSLICLAVLVHRVSRLSRRVDLARQTAVRLESLAFTDALTESPNRRAFNEQLDARFKLLGNGSGHLSIILFDLDRFKQINDSHGHDVGDLCLKLVAARVQGLLRRGGDFFARIGGEEFAVLLSDVTMAQAEGLAERIRVAIAEEPISDMKFQLTASFGVSTSASGGEDDMERLFRRADEALYQAKTTGRNKVCVQHKTI